MKLLRLFILIDEKKNVTLQAKDQNLYCKRSDNYWSSEVFILQWSINLFFFLHICNSTFLLKECLHFLKSLLFMVEDIFQISTVKRVSVFSVPVLHLCYFRIGCQWVYFKVFPVLSVLYFLPETKEKIKRYTQ